MYQPITPKRGDKLPTYRKRKGGDTWHWCRNCSNDPKENYDEVTLYGTTRPSSGELDNECRAKEKAGTCET